MEGKEVSSSRHWSFRLRPVGEGESCSPWFNGKHFSSTHLQALRYPISSLQYIPLVQELNATVFNEWGNGERFSRMAHVLGCLLENNVLGLGASLDGHADFGVFHFVAPHEWPCRHAVDNLRFCSVNHPKKGGEKHTYQHEHFQILLIVVHDIRHETKPS